MKRTGFLFVAGILFASGAAAQSQADVQASTQAGGQTSVQAGKAQAHGSGSASAASAGSVQKGQTNASLGSGAAINAELSAPIDSKKAKQGDPVAARTTEPTKSNGKTVIPKGSRLAGHVTQASGQSAVPANAGDDMAAMGGAGGGSAMGSGRAAGSSALGGVTSTAGGDAGTVTNTAASGGSTAGGALNSTVHSATNTAAAGQGAMGGLNAAGQLTSSSRGVFGMQGVNLRS